MEGYQGVQLARTQQPDVILLAINLPAAKGFVVHDVVGMSSSVLFFPDSRDRYEAALRAVVTTGEPAELDAEILAPDGTSAWYRSQMFPYREGPHIVGAVITGTNVTKVKAVEEETAVMRRLLPLCSWCRRIRSDDGEWELIEEYLKKKDKSQSDRPSSMNASAVTGFIATRPGTRLLSTSLPMIQPHNAAQPATIAATAAA